MEKVELDRTYPQKTCHTHQPNALVWTDQGKEKEAVLGTAEEAPRQKSLGVGSSRMISLKLLITELSGC